MNIALDIGHANNTGSRGNGMEEHAASITIVDHLFTVLKDQGHNVHVIDFPNMSNSEDLNATIRAANAGDYDFGISIHCDSASIDHTDEEGNITKVPNPQPHGAHVCFYPGSVKGSRLAACIAEPLADLLPGRANTIQPRPGLVILKKTRMPWVLCECGFISNPGDADVMKHHPESIANAIAQGVEDFSINQ
ncbi:N-acetylmuramoyl-L-alanine amidase [Akkermansia sp.]|uniref:N-acetylmuramoyl-L-alanine amidase n=1 Tax=Akkermansia sp. TaxID=1872421 RepID=UPI0025C38280|nr:N-acetylmuramoyl-L-alanine amidase [Akkermansia sp.]MCD8063973.1 N-acetylmuramoyl-L-alanine amidase [Akkermansia sp.]